MPSNIAEAFDVLVHVIALQLLASCYTFMPGSSASHIPWFQQRKGTKFITALHLQSQYRFAPAAGHHARASSETAAWPGLYIGPMPEDNLLQVTCQRRRLKKRSSEYVPHFVASGWIDGPAESHQARGKARSIASSVSSSEPGLFSRLTCHASMPRNSLRRHNILFPGRLSLKRKKHPAGHPTASSRRCPCPKPPYRFASRDVQRILSTLRLRRTRWAKQAASQRTEPISTSHLSRRHSAVPSVDSLLKYPFAIPEIRRISATPAASQRMQPLINDTVRAYGRGDLICTQEDLGEARMHPHNTSTDTLNSPRKCSDEQSIFTRLPTATTSSDYFRTDYHTEHDEVQAYGVDTPKSDLCNVELDMDKEARLKMMLSKRQESDYEESSDSDMELCKKRKSILIEAGATVYEVVERSKRQGKDRLVRG